MAYRSRGRGRRRSFRRRGSTGRRRSFSMRGRRSMRRFGRRSATSRRPKRIGDRF